MGIPWLSHRALVRDLIFLSQVDSCIFLWWRASSSYQNFSWRKSNRGRALIELACTAIIELFDWPFIFIYIVAETYLRIYIVSKQIDKCLIGIPVHGWEFEKGLFDWAIVINMDTVFEHEVTKVLIGLDKVIQHLKILEVSAFIVIEDIEVVFIGVQLHILALINKL